MAGQASGHDLSRVGHAVIVSPELGRPGPASCFCRQERTREARPTVRHVYQGPCPRAKLEDCVTLDFSY